LSIGLIAINGVLFAIVKDRARQRRNRPLPDQKSELRDFKELYGHKYKNKIKIKIKVLGSAILKSRPLPLMLADRRPSALLEM
jgi:hypothetical protein